jgi:NAD(P)-dependent dehydrogenase (short-subunit alcohol dehydrogenase family)
MELAQVKAVVTGGASGLGFAVAQHFVATGGNVVLLDVNDEKGQAAAQSLGASAPT